MVVVSSVQTLIGCGVAGVASAGSYRATSAIAEPFGVAVGPDGALYFCDLGNHRICQLALDERRLEVVAGTGVAGYAGDGGAAGDALLDEPYEIRFDGDGDLYFVDMTTHVIRRIDARSGTISTVAGSGEAGFAGDGGSAVHASFDKPHSIEISPQGDALYVADIGNHRVRRIDLSTGVIDAFIGQGGKRRFADGAPLDEVDFFGPRTMAFDDAGDLIVALREGNRVFRVDMREHTVHLLAGTGEFGYAGDGAAAVDAQLAGPKGMAVHGSLIYLADTESHTIRCIDRSSGRIETIVGTGEQGDGPDGDPRSCALARPHGVCVDHKGRVYIGDSDNHRIRLYTP